MRHYSFHFRTDNAPRLFGTPKPDFQLEQLRVYEKVINGKERYDLN